MSDLWFSVLECTCDDSVRALDLGRAGRHSATCLLACGATPPWSTFGKTSCRMSHGHVGAANGRRVIRHDNCAGTMWIDPEDECGEVSPGKINVRCNRERDHIGGHFDGVGIGTRW